MTDTLAEKAGTHKHQGVYCSCGELAVECGRLYLWDEIRRLRQLLRAQGIEK